jgi:hypothetical protein
MRKFTLVLAALLLVGGAAFASDVTVSGVVNHAWGFGDGVYALNNSEMDLKFVAVVDEINTATIKFEQQAVTRGTTEDLAEIDDLFIVTNLGAALGLEGQTLTTKVGYYETDNFNVSTVTGLELEDAADTGSQEYAVQLDYAFGSAVKVRMVLVPGDGDEMDGLVALSAGIGPAMVEFYYTDGNAAKPDAGSIGVGAMFGQEVVPGTVDLSVGADFKYQLDAAAGAAEFFYGVGASAGLAGGIATVGVSFAGQDGSEANAVGVDVNLAPVAFAGLDFVVAMGLDGDVYEESMQYLEASAYLKPGAASYRLGYAFYNDLGVKDGGELYNDYNAGGFIAGAESGFMFLNVKLEF